MNASFGGTICAERTALVKGVSEGAKRFTAIAGGGGRGRCVAVRICRQVLNEFSRDMRVICGAKATGNIHGVPLRELLPRSFGPEDLKYQTSEEDNP